MKFLSASISVKGELNSCLHFTVRLVVCTKLCSVYFYEIYHFIPVVMKQHYCIIPLFQMVMNLNELCEETELIEGE